MRPPARGGGRQFGHNLRSLFGWRDGARDVREEMALHVELRTADLEARGVPSAAARAQAQREVGSAPAVADAVARIASSTDRASARRQWTGEWFADVRYALRLLLQHPGFSLLAILTIALGLGANAAMFAVVNTLFFRPLPFDPEDRLVRVREYRQNADGVRTAVDASRRTADAVADRPDLFESSVAMVGTSLALLRDDGAVHVPAMGVGPRFCAVVGIRPVLGRAFAPEEEAAGPDAGVMLISHRMWQAAFGGRPDVIGLRVGFDGRSMAIVGVLPPAFHVPYDTDVWFPSRFGVEQRSVFILARLAPGVTREQAIGELDGMGRRLNAAYPEVMRGLGVTAVGAREYFVDNDDRVPLALMGAVGFLLLIGCANVALLLTVRFASRRREVAVRAALGCGRLRQVRQFTTEAMLLFTAGGAAGLVLAAWFRDLLVVLLPDTMATQVGLEGLPFDSVVIAFTLALAAATGIGFGVLSAVRATRVDLLEVLKEAGRSTAGDRSRGTLRALAAAEVALALVLLIAAGIMTGAFHRLQQRHLGFDPHGLLTVQADMTASRYASADARRAYVDRLLEQVRALPGVGPAGITSVNPLCCGNWGMRMSPEGYPPGPDALLPIVRHQLVTPGYFEAMHIRLLDGRAFEPGDTNGRELVAVIDEGMARRFWPGERAIGKRVKRGGPSSEYPWMTVVGVVAAIEAEGDYTESWYLPYAQHAAGPSADRLHLMVRAADPLAQVAAVRAAAAAVDPALALHDATTMDRVQSERLEQNRMGAVVVLVLAIAGLLLASLGLYGVLSFVLAGDVHELGLRLAFGASSHHIARLVAGRGLQIVGSGLALGGLAAVVIARALGQVLPEAELDASILIVSIGALLVAALVATAIPLRRVLRLDPLQALRAE